MNALGTRGTDQIRSYFLPILRPIARLLQQRQNAAIRSTVDVKDPLPLLDRKLRRGLIPYLLALLDRRLKLIDLKNRNNENQKLAELIKNSKVILPSVQVRGRGRGITLT
jgi:hypothetical protein